MKSLLQLKFIPLNPGLALFLLRISLGICMLSLHGFTLLKNVINGQGGLANYLHIGSKTTLVLAMLVEVVGSFFLIIGFLGRASALALAVAMGIAFGVWHHGIIAQGEMAFIYLAGFLTIVFAGPGKYAVDRT